MIGNNTVPSEARMLMKHVCELDAERLTVVAEGQFMAAKFAGIVACRDIQDTETNAGWLRLRNTFGQVDFMAKPIGRFVTNHILPEVQKKRGYFAEHNRPVKNVESIDVSVGQAAWLFLDGDLDRTEIEAAEDIVNNWRTTSFQNGTDHHDYHSERLGWKVPIDLDLKMAGMDLERIPLNILLDRWNDQRPGVKLVV
jgi:hypothetical protein